MHIDIPTVVFTRKTQKITNSAGAYCNSSNYLEQQILCPVTPFCLPVTL